MVSNVGEHKKRQHGGEIKTIQCSECDKKFHQRKRYAIHLLQVHNIAYQWN